MLDSIPGSSMLTSLQAMRAVSGDQYPHLLRIAGLERFLRPLTADDPAAAGTSDEIARLYGAIYEILGEAPTRQFFRNSGQALITAVRESPVPAALQQGMAHLPPADQLGWVLGQIVEITNNTWMPSRLSEDATAWYITFPHCTTCQYIRGAKAPICAGSESYFSMLLRHILGRRILVTEVECAAVRGLHCKVRIPK